MKLHLNLVNAVCESLRLIFDENRYADKVLERMLKSNKLWGARDRAFIAENTYDMVRNWRLIRDVSELEQAALNQQNLYTLFATWQILKGETLPHWLEFRNADAKVIRHNFNQVKTQRKLLYSLPDWLDELGWQQLEKQWNREIEAMSRPAPIIIRVNTLKTTKAELQKLLGAQQVKTESISGLKDGLMLQQRSNLFALDEFKSGLFEIQDSASQLVAETLQPEPGMKVVDACAGAGGKSLHIACLMQNKGRILSLDTEQWKLDELKKRARRAGAGNIETRLIDSGKVLKKLQGTADRLLLDVPCSGLGVLRRNPDAKWKLSPAFVEKTIETQKQILESYSKILKTRGKMVYATCSILPAENQNQVRAFLQHHPEFELEEEKRIFTSETGFDGFYMARLIKVQHT